MFLNFPFALFHFILLPCCLSLFFFPFFDFSSSFPLNIYLSFLLSSSASPFIPFPSLFLFLIFIFTVPFSSSKIRTSPPSRFPFFSHLLLIFPLPFFPFPSFFHGPHLSFPLFPSYLSQFPSFPLSFCSFPFSPTQHSLYLLLLIPSSPSPLLPCFISAHSLFPLLLCLIYPSSPPFPPTSLLPHFPCTSLPSLLSFSSFFLNFPLYIVQFPIVFRLPFFLQASSPPLLPPPLLHTPPHANGCIFGQTIFPNVSTLLCGWN
jgi:hypothetical protein